MAIPAIFTFNNGSYGCLKPSNLTNDFTICNGGINPAVFNVADYYSTATNQNNGLVLTDPSQSNMPKTMYCVNGGINTTGSPSNSPYMLCATKPITSDVQNYAQTNSVNQQNSSQLIIIILIILIILFVIANQN